MARVNSLIPASSRRAIQEYLMKEGVIVVKKDPSMLKHESLDMPNLHVMMTLRSMKSRNFVTEQYNWRYLYYVLNDEGLEFLRQTLHVPASVAPDTHHQRARPIRGGDRGGERPQRERGPRPERAY